MSTKVDSQGASTLVVNTYAVLQRAVEEGIAVGIRRAHKHTDTPTEDQMIQHIENAVMNSICEVFNVDTTGA